MSHVLEKLPENAPEFPFIHSICFHFKSLGRQPAEETVRKDIPDSARMRRNLGFSIAKIEPGKSQVQDRFVSVFAWQNCECFLEDLYSQGFERKCAVMSKYEIVYLTNLFLEFFKEFFSTDSNKCAKHEAINLCLLLLHLSVFLELSLHNCKLHPAIQLAVIVRVVRYHRFAFTITFGCDT